MKKLFLSILILTTLFLCSSASAVTITFEDWGFSPNGTVIQPVDEMTLLGLTLNNSTPELINGERRDGYGTFETYGTLSATGIQNDEVPLGGGITGLGVDYEITAVLITSGFYERPIANNELTFTAGSLNLYADSALNYGTTDSMYGADDGSLLASFDLLTGYGEFDFQVDLTEVSGFTDILFKSTFLRENTWFDPDGNDLSLYPYEFMIGLTDSNNSVVDGNDTAASEFTDASGLVYEEQTIDNFFLRTDGSFSPSANPVPEPATLFLLGSGLIGLAGICRRKTKI